MAMAARVELRATPALVAFAQLLVLPVTDLAAVVERELSENPALDRDERPTCAGCGRVLTARRCRWCSGRSAPLPAAGAAVEASVPDRPSVAQRLLAEVAPLLAAEDRAVAAYLVDDLDSRGLLGRSVAEVAADLGVDAGRVASVIAEIRRAGPPGVCAVDVRECLLLQLADWETRREAPSLIRPLLTDHLGDLAQGQVHVLARVLGASPEEVVEARRFIASHLRPYVVFDEPPAARPAPAWPDVLVRRRRGQPDRLEVETTVPVSLAVRLDPLYARLARGPSPLAACERKELAGHVARARSFLACLGERSSTLRTVAQHVVEVQQDFVLGGIGTRVALTRAQVARALGLHESTVSRAVSHKTMLLPTGETIAFSELFGPPRSVHDCLRGLVANEACPLSDAELATELAAGGHPVARRTVAKYRAQLGIAAQHLR